MDIKIELKALSVNAAWQGKRHKTEAYKRFERDALLMLPKTEKITGELKISYIFGLKSYGLTDADNLVKPIQDCLVKKGIISDDRYIKEYSITKEKSHYDYIKIKIEKIN